MIASHNSLPLALYLCFVSILLQILQPYCVLFVQTNSEINLTNLTPIKSIWKCWQWGYRIQIYIQIQMKSESLTRFEPFPPAVAINMSGCIEPFHNFKPSNLIGSSSLGFNSDDFSIFQRLNQRSESWDTSEERLILRKILTFILVPSATMCSCGVRVRIIILFSLSSCCCTHDQARSYFWAH